MRITIVGFNLPGSEFCAAGGPIMTNVHVGVQHGREPMGLVPADAETTSWDVDVDVVERDGDLDFRGAVVQGKRGDRFVYLTWGEVHADGAFAMFRRAKLMLDRIDHATLDAARAAGHLVARVDLTGGDGGPRCARVDPPAIDWSAPPTRATSQSHPG